MPTPAFQATAFQGNAFQVDFSLVTPNPVVIAFTVPAPTVETGVAPDPNALPLVDVLAPEPLVVVGVTEVDPT